MLQHILRPVVRRTQTGVRSYIKMTEDVRPPHMDELPVPCGSWQEAYDRAQKRYNLQLAAGVLGLIGTIAIGRITGLLWLNYLPPKPKN